jgi:alkylhydroperoxidase family enzyme
MQKRVNICQTEPQAYNSMFAIEKYLQSTQLNLTEEITLVQNGISEETYQKAASLFDENYLAQLIMEIVTINAWNRIGISTLLQRS